MTYDKTYKNTEYVFGREPETILEKYVHKIDPSKTVLDIGIGQGRNAFYLARNGYPVDGIDPSAVAIKGVADTSIKKNFNINTYQVGFDEFTPRKLPYSAILVFGLIQILDWKSIHKLVDRIDRWTHKGSLVFITAFSVKDATHNKYSSEGKQMGKHSFSDGKGNCRTFLEPNEILKLFRDYQAIYHWEGLGPEHRHGSGPIERHDMIELVIEKR